MCPRLCLDTDVTCVVCPPSLRTHPNPERNYCSLRTTPHRLEYLKTGFQQVVLLGRLGGVALLWQEACWGAEAHTNSSLLSLLYACS